MSNNRETLAGRTALITGAGQRIGRAIALALAARGVNIIAHYKRSKNEADALVAEARALGVESWSVGCNLEELESVSGLLERALALSTGRCDILINNASSYPESHLLSVTADEIEQMVRLHAIAPLLLAQRFAALGGEGDIINLLDTRITTYDKKHAAYHLSKRMLFSLTRMLALELAPRIKVNGIAPGAVLPPEGLGNEFLERISQSNPMLRHGSAEELAQTLLMLLENRFITGQVIYYDGGYHLKAATYA